MIANIFLFILGGACAVHLLCLANFTPKGAPLTIGLELAFGVGSSVGAAMAALQNNLDRSFEFFVVTAVFALIYLVDTTARYGFDYDLHLGQFWPDDGHKNATNKIYSRRATDLKPEQTTQNKNEMSPTSNGA